MGVAIIVLLCSAVMGGVLARLFRGGGDSGERETEAPPGPSRVSDQDRAILVSYYTLK